MELTVGQKVWVDPSKSFRNSKEPYEATVSKVGRKYFELEDSFREKYDLQNGNEVSETSTYAKKVYLTLQEITDKRDREKILSELRHQFAYIHSPKHSLEQLRKVAEILNIELK
jgi:hypothetical protein